MLPRYPSPVRTRWAQNFPHVFSQAEYRLMRGHTAYAAAKSGSSDEAALTLVYDLINDRMTAEIRHFVAGRHPRIVAVHAQEAAGRNRIPVAYAEALAKILNCPTDPGIIQASIANHSHAPSIYHRMVSQPSFDGYVEKGADYIIVDDTCTAGGTLTNLKGHIEHNGGNVIAMSVLGRANAQSKYYIALSTATLARVNHRHRGLETFWAEEFGNGLETITEGEAGHLLAAATLDTIRNRLAEARRDLGLNRDETIDSGEERPPERVDQKPDGT